MHLNNASVSKRRFAANAGIAIGPILFIIAILGILATAIAAGSGSFTNNTTKESNNTKAIALIDIGNSMSTGFQRILGSGATVPDVVIDSAQTTQAIQLFSPIGGGVSDPPLTMRVSTIDPAFSATNDVWYYPLIKIPGVGFSYSRLAMLRVDAGVCDQVNVKASGVTIPATEGGTTSDSTLGGAVLDTYTTAKGTDTGGTGELFGSGTNEGVDAASGAAGVKWPTEQTGKSVGCVHYHGATNAVAGYYFYQVLGTM